MAVCFLSNTRVSACFQFANVISHIALCSVLQTADAFSLILLGKIQDVEIKGGFVKVGKRTNTLTTGFHGSKDLLKDKLPQSCLLKLL